jgi:hypothetical protein
MSRLQGTLPHILQPSSVFFTYAMNWSAGCHVLAPALERLLHERHELVGDGAVYQAVVAV